MPVTPGLITRLRVAETAARAVPGPADDDAAARLAAALAGLASPLLRRALDLCDMDDEQAAASLLGDSELTAALERLMALADG